MGKIPRCAAAVLALTLTLAAGSSQPGTGAGAVLDALLPDGRRTESLHSLAASQTLEPSEAFRIVERIDRQPGLHHGFRHEILGVRSVAGEAHGEPVQSIDVLLYGQRELALGRLSFGAGVGSHWLS